ncbi:MAG TPA: Crp/Fnr family transcriptional regulator [Myxococcota bacterium]
MKRDELLGHLRRNEIFAGVDDARLGRLVDVAEVLTFDKDGRILEEGDASEHLFVLIKGVVGVFYSSADGVDVLVKIFGAPAVFGEMELIFGQPRQEYVECFEPCVAARLPAKVFMDFMKNDPHACFTMLKDVSSRLAIAAYNERALAFLDANTRLAGLFLSFLEAYGERTTDGITLRIKLTYEMLARCLGVTVRSIDRAMTDWAREGWLTKNRGTYTFHDLEKLEDKADPERLALFSRLGLLPHTAGELLDDV